MEPETKLVTLPLAELERLKEKNRRQAREITYLRDCLRQRNLDLDAMSFVWCDGSCPNGVHRFSPDAILTQEMVERAERNVKRLTRWYNGVKWKAEHYPSMSEWHNSYVKRAVAKTDLAATERPDVQAPGPLVLQEKEDRRRWWWLRSSKKS